MKPPAPVTSMRLSVCMCSFPFALSEVRTPSRGRLQTRTQPAWHVIRHCPVPDRPTTWGLLLPAALCDTVITPLTIPVWVGVNVTAKVHDPGVGPLTGATVDTHGAEPPEATE